jgi:hypothetical protein
MGAFLSMCQFHLANYFNRLTIRFRCLIVTIVPGVAISLVQI